MSYIERKITNVWLIILILIMLVLISLSFFKYQPYILKYGEFTSECISVYLEDSEISELTKVLKYKGERYIYEIIEISSDYVIFENKFKRNVKIKVPIESDNYIVELYLEQGEEVSIWGHFYKKYMKGVV